MYVTRILCTFSKCWLQIASLMLYYGSFSLPFELRSFGSEEKAWKLDLFIVWKDKCCGNSFILIRILNIIQAYYSQSTLTTAVHTFLSDVDTTGCVQAPGLPVDTLYIWTHSMTVEYAYSGQRSVALHKHRSASLSPTIGCQIRRLGATSANKAIKVTRIQGGSGVIIGL